LLNSPLAELSSSLLQAKNAIAVANTRNRNVVFENFIELDFWYLF
jgi:hypothetical protein